MLNSLSVLKRKKKHLIFNHIIASQKICVGKIKPTKFNRLHIAESLYKAKNTRSIQHWQMIENPREMSALLWYLRISSSVRFTSAHKHEAWKNVFPTIFG